MAMSFGLENISNSVVTNADKINNLITGIFYPIKLYLNLINKLNAIDIIKLIIINIVPAYLFVLLASKFNLTIANNNSNKISSKKKNGYKRSTELSAQYHLYRQNYCGCVFSKREAAQRAEEQREEREKK